MKNIRNIAAAAMVGILGVLLSCNNVLNTPDAPEPPATTEASVTIEVSGHEGRTVLPNAEIGRYRLFGGKTGEQETEQAVFTTGETTLRLTAGTWNFTLNAYNGADEIVMQALSLETELEPAESHRIVFNLLPLMDGTGNIHIELRFPNYAGITAVTTSGELGEESLTVPAGGGSVTWTKTGVEAGSYIISFTLYQGDKRAAVISEAVIVGKGLTSGKVLTLTRSDLKPDILTVVDEGTTLAEKFAWLDSNAQNGGSYIIEAAADESLAPRILEYAGSEGIFITLTGLESNRTISLSGKGSVFTVGKGVTLALDANITLWGLADNTASLVTVTDGGTLLLNEGAVITGNTVTNDGGGGGVYVANGGTFTMYGGEIAGNTARVGGGVYAELTGTLIKTGGIITGYGNDTQNGNRSTYNSQGHAVCSIQGVVFINNTLSVNDNISKKYDPIPLIADTWADGNIPAIGEQWFKFTATAATQNIHAEFGTLTRLIVRVYDSGYNYVGGQSIDRETRFTSHNVVAGQEYYIRVWPSTSSDKGTYKIKYNASLTPPEAVTELTADTWANGNISSFSSQWFKFTAAAAIQYIHAEFNTLKNIYVTVYDSANNAVGRTANLYGNAFTSSISYSVTAGEEYYIRVWPYSGSGMSGSGIYRIKYNSSAAAGAAVTELTENTWADGNIPEANGEQWFKFTATAATQYIHADFGTLTDLYVQMYDNGYNAIGDRAHLYSSTQFTSRNVVAGQEYYVRVQPYLSSITGTYKIGFNTSVVTPESVVTPLTTNTWEDGDIPEGGRSQWFKFTATAATQYIHAGFGTLTYLYVQMYDSGYNTVGDDSYLVRGQKFTSRDVTTGQEYYIRVRSQSKGTYKIGFNESMVAPEVTIPTLLAGTWTNGDLPPDEYGEQWFKFTATAAAQYIHASFGTLLYLNVQVYDSGYKAVGSETTLERSIRFTSQTLTVGQEYYIRVRPSSSSGKGTYKIGFNTSVVTPESVVTPLTADTWADGYIPEAYGDQWFKFTATAASGYIHFDTLSYLSVGVYDSAYNTIKSIGSIVSISGHGYVPLAVTAGQEYYVQVTHYYNQLTYKIMFSASPLLTGTTVTELAADTWADKHMLYEEQWFKFTATAATQYLHAGFVTLTELYAQVYDSNWNIIGSDIHLSDSTRFTSLAVTAGQVYFVQIYSYEINKTGSYKIGFTKSIITPGVTVTPLAVNTWEVGDTYDGDQWYKFTATAATQYIHAVFVDTLTELNVQVYDSDLNTIGSSTRLSGSTQFTSLVVTAGWEYYVRVWPYSGTGAYGIGFNESGVTPGSTVTTLAANTWADGEIPEASGEQWYKFTATAAVQYIHAGFGTLTDLYAQVYDSGWNMIGSGTRLSSLLRYITRPLTAGQEYYVRVWPYSTYSGTYRIGFNESVFTPETRVTTLAANTWADGEIPEAGGEQWYKFTATAAVQYIHAGFGTLTDLYAQVYDSGWNMIGSGTRLSSLLRYITRPLTAGQEYYVRVWPYSTYSGTYRIGFNESETAPAGE